MSAAEHTQQITLLVGETERGPVPCLEGAAPMQPCCLMQPFLTPNQWGPQAPLTLHATCLPWAPFLPWLYPGWQERVSLL